MTRALGMACALLLTSGGAWAEMNRADKDADGRVTREEFHGAAREAGNYRTWDRNDDDLIDRDEFAGIDFGDAFDADFDGWDANRDSYLEEGEFYDGVYDSYDVDENGHWDGDEWDDAGDAGLFDI